MPRAGLKGIGNCRKIPGSMRKLDLRSPSAKVGGLVYFGRMLDKIRSHAKGELPPDYQANLGKGFDASCTQLLRVNYDQLVERVKQGGTDNEILQWCFSNGRQPFEDEIHVWNEFMRKRGWNDEVSETLKRRKKEAGMTDTSEIETMFAFIDADEGRKLDTNHR
jgi:gluconokinase